MEEGKYSMGSEELALLKLSGLRPLPGAGQVLDAVDNHERFVWLANEHGVAAFVRKNIDEAGLSERLPPTDYQRLRNQALRSVARNSFIMGAVKDAARILNSAGIIPVFLKGTALELTVYRESGLRPMSDADILLPYEYCMKAWKLLQKQGFSSLPLKSPLHRMLLMHIGKHLPPLVKGGFSLEIHHTLFKAKGERQKEKGKTHDKREKIDVSEAVMVIEDAAGNIEVGIPSPGIHFLYLVTHLSRHEDEGHSQLRLYNDLSVMLQSYDSESVILSSLALAEPISAGARVLSKLGLLKKYFGVKIPSGVDVTPDPEDEKRFLEFLSNPKNNPPVDKKGDFRSKVMSIPGLHRKIIYLAGDIFPGIGFMKRRYGRSSALAVLPYYFIRPGKLWWLVK